MTTSYVVKRCKSLAFAKSFEHLSESFNEQELSAENVIFIGDDIDESNNYFNNNTYNESNTRIIYDWQHNPKSISDLEYINVNDYISPLIVVELARHKHHTITIPNEDPTDINTISNLDCNKLNIDSDAINECKDTIISYLDDSSILSEKKLSNEFMRFIVHVYMNINDGNNKLALLKLLNDNNYNTSDIEIKSPVKYHEVDAYDVITTTQFDDIKIICNKDDTNLSSNVSLYKHSPDDLKKAAVGNSTQLEAFSKNKFTVIHNKKSANIENYITKRNHDILDSLARNGVVCSPNTDYELSIHTLMKRLKRFKSFDIVFIHPSYDLKIVRSEFPSERVEPSYKINEGELLAVAYRYIVLNYFGYCSVFNADMEEFGYLI